MPFKPTHLICSSFDLIHLLIIFIFNFLFPFEFSFDFDLLTSINLSTKKIAYYSIFFLTWNILVNFNTCYYKNGLLVNDRFQILKNYFKESFFQDILSIILLLIYFFDFKQLSFTKVLFLFKYSQSKKMYKR